MQRPVSAVPLWAATLRQVRSLVVPATTAALVAALHAARLLPADPVCRLALLVQASPCRFRHMRTGPH